MSKRLLNDVEWHVFRIDLCAELRSNRNKEEGKRGFCFLVSVALIVLLAIEHRAGSFFTVETAQVAIVQSFGKFACVAGPG